MASRVGGVWSRDNCRDRTLKAVTLTVSCGAGVGTVPEGGSDVSGTRPSSAADHYKVASTVIVYRFNGGIFEIGALLATGSFTSRKHLFHDTERQGVSAGRSLV